MTARRSLRRSFLLISLEHSTLLSLSTRNSTSYGVLTSLHALTFYNCPHTPRKGDKNMPEHLSLAQQHIIPGNQQAKAAMPLTWG